MEKFDFENTNLKGRLIEIGDEGFVRVLKDENGQIFLQGPPFTGWMQKAEIRDFICPDTTVAPTTIEFPGTHFRCLPSA